MDCCQCDGIDTIFDQKNAINKLENYHQKGPPKTTRILVDALKDLGVNGLSLLDVGGGIGVIQHELIKSGVKQVTSLEASKAYVDACKTEAQRQGHADQINHIQDDFVNAGDDVLPADIVTLEKVVCCYPDMVSLINQACKRTRRFLGLVYPTDTWWVKFLLNNMLNLRFIIAKIPFRVYVHPTKEVDAVIQEFGFRSLFYKRTGLWQVVVYGISE